MTDETNLHVAERTLRIANKINAMPDTSDFEAALEKATAEVDAEGASAFGAMLTATRIDIFDADVFASLRMLEELERSSNAEGWLDE